MIVSHNCGFSLVDQLKVGRLTVLLECLGCGVEWVVIAGFWMQAHYPSSSSTAGQAVGAFFSPDVSVGMYHIAEKKRAVAKAPD